jgi:hypothetical protein
MLSDTVVIVSCTYRGNVWEDLPWGNQITGIASRISSGAMIRLARRDGMSTAHHRAPLNSRGAEETASTGAG